MSSIRLAMKRSMSNPGDSTDGGGETGSSPPPAAKKKKTSLPK